MALGTALRIIRSFWSWVRTITFVGRAKQTYVLALYRWLIGSFSKNNLLISHTCIWKKHFPTPAYANKCTLPSSRLFVCSRISCCSPTSICLPAQFLVYVQLFAKDRWKWRQFSFCFEMMTSRVFREGVYLLLLFVFFWQTYVSLQKLLRQEIGVATSQVDAADAFLYPQVSVRRR